MSQERQEVSGESFDPMGQKILLQSRFLREENGAAGKNYDESRKTPGEREEIRRKQNKKYGRTPEVVAGEISQNLTPDPDFSSGPSVYVPPEDPQILEKFGRSRVDLTDVARISRELPDPVEPCASLIRSAARDPEVAELLIEEQMWGNPNGQGPSRMETFSLKPLPRWMAPSDADDFGPDSRP